MVNKQITSVSSRLCKSATSSSEVQFIVQGVPFTLNKEILAAKSDKIAALLKKNSQLEDLTQFLRDIPADPGTFEFVARFCYGFESHLSTQNVLPVICLAYYLGMTENRSTDNLLKRALTFFEKRVLPSWNETIKALLTTENILQQAMDSGLVDACLESIIDKVLVDPRLLGEPMIIPSHVHDGGDDENVYRPIARKRLFDLEWKLEDLRGLPLLLYDPIILTMKNRGVPSVYLAASLCTYAKKWVLSISIGLEKLSIHKKNSQREVVEAVERLLPHEIGLVPCTFLFEMLRFSIVLGASSDCRNGFEIRIGKELDKAKVNDLLIPSQGYAKEVQYDVECVRRILKTFYENYSSSDTSGLIAVAELVEGFLSEVAGDIDLKPDTFITLAEMSIAASLGTQRNSDGIYRAIDIYLDKHRFLTEVEKEEVCRMLDFQKMSPEACEHAAKNERLPIKVVVRVLFIGQLQLRDTITKEMQASSSSEQEENLREEVEDLAKMDCGGGSGGGDGQVKAEMEKMNNKVMELERECYVMRREIESGCSHCMKKEKVSMWKEMKRKIGCISSMHDCNCHAKKKKVHPRY